MKYGKIILITATLCLIFGFLMREIKKGSVKMTAVALERIKVPAVKNKPKQKEMIGINLNRLSLFAELKPNWDGYNAEPISLKLINIVRELLPKLQHQPSVFPDAKGLIQFEYKKETGEFLNIVFLENNQVEIFKINRKTYEDESSITIIYDPKKIIEEVETFYAV